SLDSSDRLQPTPPLDREDPENRDACWPPLQPASCIKNHATSESPAGSAFGQPAVVFNRLQTRLAIIFEGVGLEHQSATVAETLAGSNWDQPYPPCAASFRPSLAVEQTILG